MSKSSNSESSREALVIQQLVRNLYYRSAESDFLYFTERAQALSDLLKMGSYPARQAILHALLDTTLDRDIRSMIAMSLQREEQPWFLTSVWQVVGDKSDDKYVRVNAGEALAGYQSEHTTELLKAILRDTADEVNVRRMAARVLGESRAREAVEPLIETLADTNWEVQVDAASALAKLGDARAIEPLQDLLQQPDQDGRARGCAALYLTNARLLEHLTIEQRQQLAMFLRTALTDQHENIWVRLHAAGALGRLSDLGALPTLVEALRDENSGVRESVAHALGELGGVEATDALVDLLRRERDGDVRAAAIYALVDARVERSVGFVRAALSDENPRARYAAVHAAVALRDFAAVDQLTALLRDPDPYIRSYAIYAVGELGNEDSIPALLWVVANDDDVIEAGDDEDDDGRLRSMAVKAVKCIRDRSQ